MWWSYNKSTFSIVHFDRNPFTCSCEGEGIGVNGDDDDELMLNVLRCHLTY